MEESILFDDGTIKVTSKRVIFGSKTFAMSNITSVQTRVTPANRSFGVLMVAVSAVAGLFSTVMVVGALSQDASATGPGCLCPVVSAAFVAAGVAMYRAPKPIYHVVFDTNSGSTKAHSSVDEDKIRQIVDAINEAMVQRS